MNISYLYLILLFWPWTSSCESQIHTSPEGKNMTWLYQLQAAVIDSIQKSGFSTAIIDYSFDGSDHRKYTKDDIESLVNSSITPIAYLSVGEAENYRFYWNKEWVSTENKNDFTPSAPSWLGHSNPDWAGNYKVRYWDTDWRENYIKPYLDQIIEQGFKGVYLDIIDAYYYWSLPESYKGRNGEQFIEGDPINNEEEAAKRMISFVIWLADYCRENSEYSSDFKVYPQNAESIFDFDNDDSYLNAISGIGCESLWFNETTPQSKELTNYRLNYLRKLVTSNKKVCVVDYVDDGSGLTGSNKERIDTFVSNCKKENFHYYVATKDRKLDEINQIENIQP